ncbi:MAG: ATP-binding protein [Steroidobacteraceae bacterium]
MTRWRPDSLTGWTIVVLIAALAVSQLATISIINSMRSDTLEVVEHFHVAERIAGIVRLIDSVPPEQRDGLLSQVAGDTLAVSWNPAPAVASSDHADWNESLFDEIVAAALWQTPERRHRVALLAATSGSFSDRLDAVRRSANLSSDAGRVLGGAVSRNRRARVLDASIALKDGSWLNFEVPMADPSGVPGIATIVTIVASGLLILALSLWAVRRLTRPLIVLVQAADKLGRNVNAAPLPESGSREMRQAARAFNTMQERLRRFVADRLQLVAAISHDLRTPLTRLRLRAELTDNEETRRKMQQDVAEMEAMIASTLAFASEEVNPEACLQVDLVSLLESVCEGLPGVEVRIAPGVSSRLALECQPLAVRRCIGNLVGNALRYGSHAMVTLSADSERIKITVEDDGPGMAREDLERVFEPFARLDASRNRGTGGSGLGLAIARTVARNHGGDVILSNRPEGGLCATLQLPMHR